MLQCNHNLDELIKISEKLIEISIQGDMDRDDPSCGVLYGIARDTAYKLIEGAQNELEKHKNSGKWD